MKKEQFISKLFNGDFDKYTLKEIREKYPEFNSKSQTPISDKYKLSFDNFNYNNQQKINNWLYEISLLLDNIIPLYGYTNQQRIELAIRELKNYYEQK